MNRVIAILVGLAVLAAVSGCSQGSAATLQTTPNKPVDYASLAPRSGNVPINPVRIPEPRKTPTSSPSAKESKPGNSNVVQISVGQAEKKSSESNRGNNKGDRAGRGQGRGGFNRDDWRGNRTNDSGPASEKVTTTSVPDASSSSSGARKDPAPEVLEPVAPNTRSSGFFASNSSAALPVTYGSGMGDSRGFKKPTLPSGMPSWFVENDKDGDGQVSLHEWPKDRLDEFYKYDRNGDGIITIEEAMLTVPKSTPAAAPATSYSATPAASNTTTPTAVTPAPANIAGVATPPGAPTTAAGDPEISNRVERTMQFSDVNKDGFLDQQEIEQNPRLRNVDWKKYDANKDGKLDKTELVALYKAEGGNMGGGRGGGGVMAFGGPGGGGGMRMEMSGGGGRGEGGGRGGPGRGGMNGQFGGDPNAIAKVMFDNMDKNKTGKLTKDQLPNFFQSRFEEWDTNKDGFIDFEEFKAGQEKLRNSRGQGARGGGGRGGF